MLPGTEERIRSSRLQIVVLCPYLLKRVLVRPEQAMNLSRHLVPEKVLAMMLGVQEDHLTSNHKSALISYQEWRKFPVKDQDEDFVCQFFGAVFSILGTALPSSLKSDKTAFTVHPKKVKLVRIIFFFYSLRLPLFSIIYPHFPCPLPQLLHSLLHPLLSSLANTPISLLTFISPTSPP